jgi:hypothetical protein
LHPDKNPNIDPQLFVKMWEQFEKAQKTFNNPGPKASAHPGPKASAHPAPRAQRRPNNYWEAKSYDDIADMLNQDRQRDAHNVKRMNDESFAKEEAADRGGIFSGDCTHSDIFTDFMDERKTHSPDSLLAQMAKKRAADRVQVR